MLIRACLNIAVSLLAIFLVACSDRSHDTSHQQNKQHINTILVVGDSLTTGFSIATPWPSLLEVDDSVNVINFSKNGEMTNWGLFHLPALLIEHKPDVVLIMLGTNDSSRGSLTKAIENLKSMIRLSKVAGASVYVATLPPILRPGPANQRSEQLSSQIKKLSAAEIVDIRSAFNEPKGLLADGVHPSEEGSRVMAQQFSKHLKQYHRN